MMINGLEIKFDPREKMNQARRCTNWVIFEDEIKGQNYSFRECGIRVCAEHISLQNKIFL